jgi:thymidylate synthase (FAD)
VSTGKPEREGKRTGFPASTNTGDDMTARVTLLAQTMLIRERLANTPYKERPFPSDVETVMSCDELTEFAGRSVHGTWAPSLDIRTNREYVRELLSIDETALMEHSSATFWITGVSVGFAQTLNEFPGFVVTGASFDYANPEKIGVVVPSAIKHNDELTADFETHFDDAMVLYEDLIRDLIRVGFTRRQATQAARSVLPNCAETTVVLTGGLCTFRMALDEWLLPTSDAESRDVAFALLSHLQSIAPNVFQDYPARMLAAIGLSQRESLPEAESGTINEVGSASYGQSYVALRAV